MTPERRGEIANKAASTRWKTRARLIMPSEREKMESWSARQIFGSMSNSEPGTASHTRAMAEIQRRTMETEQASLEAQQKSADAALDAAKSARLSVHYALGALALAAVSIIVVSVSILHK